MKTICLILSLVLMLGGCASQPEPTPLEQISRELGVDVTSGALVSNSDSHDSFLGDGCTSIQVVIRDLQIPASAHWHPMPLSDNLTRAFYGKTEGDTHHGALFTDSAGEPLLPRIENGCWFFLDRHSQSTDPASDEDLFSRYSWNFTAAVYDIDAGILYFFRLDT